MKKTIAIIIICMLMFAGCKQNVTQIESETSSNTTSLNTSEAVSSKDVSSKSKIKKPVSSREESSSEVSSEAVSSRETTSSKPKEKPKEKDDSIYLPAKMERIYNDDTGEYVTLGMTREEVEKVFPPPEDAITGCEDESDYDYYEYYGLNFGYSEDKLVSFMSCMYNFNKKGIYCDAANGAKYNWKKANFSLGEEIKDGDSYKKVINIFKRDTVWFFLYKNKNKYKIMNYNDFDNLTKKSAKKVINIEFNNDEKNNDVIGSIMLNDYMSYVNCYWDFGLWCFKSEKKTAKLY